MTGVFIRGGDLVTDKRPPEGRQKTEGVATCQPRSEALEETKLEDNLILDLQPPVRKPFSVKSLSMWCFVITALTDTAMCI